MEVDAPTDTADIDTAYDNAIMVINSKPEKPEPKRDMEQENKDYYQSFRTRVLLFWTLSNVRRFFHPRCIVYIAELLDRRLSSQLLLCMYFPPDQLSAVY